MESIENITQEELDAFAMHHKKYEYSNDESMALINLVRKYIYNAPSCMSCTGGLREVKTNANEFYLANKEKMQMIIEKRNTPTQITNNSKNKYR